MTNTELLAHLINITHTAFLPIPADDLIDMTRDHYADLCIAELRDTIADSYLFDDLELDAMQLDADQLTDDILALIDRHYSLLHAIITTHRITNP